MVRAAEMGAAITEMEDSERHPSTLKHRLIHWALTVLLVAHGNSMGESSGADPILAEFLGVAQRLEDSTERYHGRRQVRELEEELKTVADPARKFRLLGQLCFESLRLGDLDAAGVYMGQIDEMIARSGGAPSGKVHQLRALLELRRAEVANCIKRHARECCIFPLAGTGVHTEKTPAQRAGDSLLAVLSEDPGQLDAQWLLNIVAMATGDYPDKVPERFRLPPASLESDYEIERFAEVAPQLGIDAFNLCGGAVVEDFDNDGFLDIATSTSDPRGHLTLFLNRGDGTFDDCSVAAGLGSQLGGLNCIGADYDNDGDVDLLVLRGGWMGVHGRIRNSLLRNDGGSPPRFVDVTAETGLAEPAYPTQAAVFGDFDLDGDLDLFVGNESDSQGGVYPAQLFRNDGGTKTGIGFKNVAAEAGVENGRLAKGVTAGDFDNDGDLDLYVSNIGKNRLYRNETPRERGAAMRFVDVAGELGVSGPEGRSFAPWFFDFNNDGWLDLFVTAYDATTANLMLDYLGKPHLCTPPSLYLNREGRFENVTRSYGLDHAYLPMGANFGDIDYDGYLDIYLATGDPGYETLMPNVMLRNDGGRRFQNVTTSGGFGHLQKGHGVCFADLDHDGDQDMYHQLGGFYPGDKFHNALFLNPGGGGHFLVLELAGVHCNRSAIGARIEVTVEAAGGPRTIHRAVGSVSSFGGSSIGRQEIGLGDATAVPSLSVTWPGADSPVVFRDLPIDAAVKATEGSPVLESVARKRILFPVETR